MIADDHARGPSDHDATHATKRAEQACAPDRTGTDEPTAPATGHGLAVKDPSTAVADEVIDVQAVARLLHVGRNTVYELVGRNAIPHRRLGKQIRFSRAAVLRWLDPFFARHEREGRR